MALYHEAAFTLDSRAIIEPDPPPAIGMEETERGEDLAAYSEDYRSALAGPLTLDCEDSGLELTATVGGVDDATRVALDWGDGTGADLDVGGDLTATHVYRTEGRFTVVATAQTGAGTFEVAKVREMGSSPVA